VSDLQTPATSNRAAFLFLYLYLVSFFSIRVINVWNDLPADAVDFRSLQSFKKIISTVDLSKYLSDTYS